MFHLLLKVCEQTRLFGFDCIRGHNALLMVYRIIKVKKKKLKQGTNDYSLRLKTNEGPIGACSHIIP